MTNDARKRLPFGELRTGLSLVTHTQRGYAWHAPVKEPIDDYKEPQASRGIAIQAGEILLWKGFVASGRNRWKADVSFTVTSNAISIDLG